MALRGAAARRYAQAVFDIGKDTNTLDRWLSDLTVLGGVFGNSNAVAALEDPRLTLVEQNNVVAQHVPKDLVGSMAINMLLMMVRRGRLALLPRVVELFREMYNKEKGVIVADVTTAVPLDEAHQRSVAEGIRRLTGGKSVELRLHQDPTILGGMITRIGDELIDASIASRLAALSERLS